MNEKLNLNDLSDILATRSGISKKDADRFLREYFALATEVISKGETLKISGLGIFKPVWVADRVSVNVQTGESFKIAGHYKLSFVPEKSFREVINAPFSCFESVDLNDHYDESMLDRKPADLVFKEKNQAEPEEKIQSEESVDVQVSELSGESFPEADTKGVSDFESDENEIVVDDSSRVETNKNETLVVLTAEISDLVSDKEKLEKPEIRQNERKNSALKVIALILLFCCITAVAYVIYMMYEQNRLFYTDDSGETRVESVSSLTDLAARIKTDSIPLSEESVSGEKTVTGDTLSSAFPTPVISEKKPVKEVITEGVFLTKLALKHFGNKAFWVYIYLENQANIPNPDAIPIGTELMIPSPDKYDIDSTDSASIDKAKTLANDILKRKE